VEAWTEALRGVRRQPRRPRPQPTMDGHWSRMEEMYEQVTRTVAL
jgi:hypothetical protein